MNLVCLSLCRYTKEGGAAVLVTFQTRAAAEAAMAKGGKAGDVELKMAWANAPPAPEASADAPVDAPIDAPVDAAPVPVD